MKPKLSKKQVNQLKNSKFFTQLFENTKEWQKRYNKTKIPFCQKCGKDMKKAYDRIAKKKTGYMWEYDCNKDCEDYGKNKKLRLCIGGNL